MVKQKYLEENSIIYLWQDPKCRSRYSRMSSIVNEAIKGNLKHPYYFFTREFTHTKSKKYIQANKNKKDNYYVHKNI